MKRKLLIKQLTLVLFVILFANTLSAQEITLPGTVTSETGLPLSGVSVMIEGSSTGMLTDDKGYFTLHLSGKNPVIIFSYTGMITQKVKYANQTVLNIAMKQDERSLSDVVVTAVGLERSKKSLGYSATVIGGAPLAQARETNIINSLKGRVAGV